MFGASNKQYKTFHSLLKKLLIYLSKFISRCMCNFGYTLIHIGDFMDIHKYRHELYNKIPNKVTLTFWLVPNIVFELLQLSKGNKFRFKLVLYSSNIEIKIKFSIVCVVQIILLEIMILLNVHFPLL